MTYKVACNFTDFPMLDPVEEAKINAKMTIIKCSTEAELIDACTDADAVVAGRLNSFPRSVIGNLSKCRLIHRMAAGYENIDVDAATDYAICVSNAGDFNSEEVAEHAMTMMLASARKLIRFDQRVRQGKWNAEGRAELQKLLRPMHQVKGKTLGIIGFGNVGRLLVPKARGFEMRVMAYDPFTKQEWFDKLGVQRVTLEKLLAESDFVTVHAALTNDTKHMMSTAQFNKMKPSAFFVNCSRGELVDEKALITALQNGNIAGAGIDVVERQPGQEECIKPGHPFLKMDNVIITPHTAYFSDETDILQKQRAYEHCGQIFRGDWPTWFINPKVKEAYSKKWGK